MESDQERLRCPCLFGPASFASSSMFFFSSSAFCLRSFSMNPACVRVLGFGEASRSARQVSRSFRRPQFSSTYIAVIAPWTMQLTAAGSLNHPISQESNMLKQKITKIKKRIETVE